MNKQQHDKLSSITREANMLVGDVRTAGNVVVPHAEDFLGELERVMAKFGVVKLDVSVVAPVQRADNSAMVPCDVCGVGCGHYRVCSDCVEEQSLPLLPSCAQHQ